MENAFVQEQSMELLEVQNQMKSPKEQKPLPKVQPGLYERGINLGYAPTSLMEHEEYYSRVCS